VLGREIFWYWMTRDSLFRSQCCHGTVFEVVARCRNLGPFLILQIVAVGSSTCYCFLSEFTVSGPAMVRVFRHGLCPRRTWFGAAPSTPGLLYLLYVAATSAKFGLRANMKLTFILLMWNIW
jgi:hypothetical protein